MGPIPAIAHQRIPLISGWKRTNLPSFPLLLGLPFWRNPRPRLRLAVFAEGNGGGGDHLKGGRRGEPPPPQQFELRWRDLLNPDPENIVAVGLAGLLTWASVLVLVQLFFISVAILLAALKERESSAERSSAAFREGVGARDRRTSGESTNNGVRDPVRAPVTAERSSRGARLQQSRRGQLG